MIDRLRGDSPAEGATLQGMTRGQFLKRAGAAGLLVSVSGTLITVFDENAEAQLLPPIGDLLGGGGSSAPGSFSAPFVEPVIWVGSGDNQTPVTTSAKCIKKDDRYWCKPAAGSVGLLPDQRLIYWNALEGTENSAAFVLDADVALDNDDSRILTIGNPPSSSTWKRPANQEGGVTDDNESELLLQLLVTSDVQHSNGTMFCAHNVHLPDGSIIVAGGTHYYQEPLAVELEGLDQVRVFSWRTDSWHLVDSMDFGRWYPALCALSNGDVFVCSGVHKLEKPVYLPPQETGEPAFYETGKNVVHTETYSLSTAKWTDNGTGAQRSLPLMPRIHLAPNGHVIFNGAGQAFSPNGQSYDQATWNLVASYNPQTHSWQEVGFAGLPFTLNNVAATAIAEQAGTTLVSAVPTGQEIRNSSDLQSALTGLLVKAPSDATGASNVAGIGSRLSTFEVPLLMEPDASGNYNTMELLTSGGTIGAVVATDPGSYLATNLSRIDTFKTNGNNIDYHSRFTATMHNRRWFSSGTLLPNGEVFACSGADRDEVILPGAEQHVQVAEMFDPKTETWREVAKSAIPRTYHNSAVLLSDGRVLVGGHAPIPTGYLSHVTIAPGFGPNDGREPRFEIYSPPYVSKPRPTISSWPSNDPKNPVKKKLGENITIQTPNAADVDFVVLMRVSSVTHVNDTEQRGVKLAFTRSGNTLTAKMPSTSQPAVLPPGYYRLYIVNKAGVPSVGQLVLVPRP